MRLFSLNYKMKIDSISLNDPKWEFLTIKEREEKIFPLFRSQFLHNKLKIPFYRRYYRDTNEANIGDYQGCVKNIPALIKNSIRSLSPYDLIPDDGLKKIFIHRGTGGTTGEPTSVFYSKNDWQAAIFGANRMLYEPISGIDIPLISFNNYNQGHVSGPIFDDMVKDLGGIPIKRNFGSSDENAVHQMKKHKCNLI